MIHKELITTRLLFSHNESMGGLKKEATKIYELSEGYVYLLCSDGCEKPCDDEFIHHKLDYYLNPTTYVPKRDNAYRFYFGVDFRLKFDRIFSSIFYKKYRIPEDYTILKIYDIKTLNFFLSTNNEEEMHIFSSDFDQNFLKTYLDEYYQNLDKYRSMRSYEYILSKHGDYIAAKKFIFYDTYADDEDSRYLFITGNKKVYDNVVNFFGCER